MDKRYLQRLTTHDLLWIACRARAENVTGGDRHSRQIEREVQHELIMRSEPDSIVGIHARAGSFHAAYQFITG